MADVIKQHLCKPVCEDVARVPVVATLPVPLDFWAPVQVTR